MPWCDQPLSKETDCIRDKLISLNRLEFLTINSQPSVNGVDSNHPVFGWGPKNGYVYQKAYLELFVAKDKLPSLLQSIRSHPTVTFYAVNKKGELTTNAESESPNAVTWGVFPGKEIVQPTVVDPVSFLAWKVSVFTVKLVLISSLKDEAFELWAEWARTYAEGSPTQEFLQNASNDCFLVNIVENDFVQGNVFSIFEKFKKQTATR